MPDDLALHSMDPRLGIGGNAPPTEAELLRERLAISAADLTKRADELVGAAGRIPAKIEDESTAGKLAAFVKQITVHEKAVEERRKTEKGVFDELGKVVQGFFTPVLDKLSGAKRTANDRLLAYQRELQRQAEESRLRAEEEARRQREAAEKLAAAAQTDADLNKAIAIEEKAQQAEQQAAAVAPAPTQIRSDYGAVASVRKTLAYELTDLAQVPRQFLMLNEKAVKAHMATAPKGQLPAAVAGLRFFFNEQMVSR